MLLKVAGVFVILILFLAGIGFWRLRESPSNKTSFGDTIEQRVENLETSVSAILKQIGGIDSAPKDTTLQKQVNQIEDAVTDLQTKVSKLEGTSTTSTTTQTSSSTTTTQRSPVYIPLGTDGSSISTDWTTVDTLQADIDPAEYSGYKSMQLELNLRVNQGNGKAFARLYNKAKGTAILSSEVSTTSPTYVYITSPTFTLPSGKENYRLQLKSLTGYSVDAQNIRIKVNF